MQHPIVEPHKENLSLADKFITGAQIAQELCGKKLVGQLKIDQEIYQGILRFVSKSPDLKDYSANIPSFPSAVETLLIKFEGMCLRRNIASPPATFREKVYSKLSSNLYENTLFFDCLPALLVSPTLLSPVSLKDAFSKEPLRWFKENQHGAVMRAFSCNPGNPARYMLETHSRIQEIRSYLTHQGRTLPASTQLKIAMGSHQTNPEDLVRAHFAISESICQENEFAPIFAKKSHIVEHAVNNYGEKGARGFLRKVMEISHQISLDQRFAALHNSKGTIMIATMLHLEQTADFIESMLAREQRIRELASTLNIKLSNKELRTLCLKTPLRAKELEMTLRVELAEHLTRKAIAP